MLSILFSAPPKSLAKPTITLVVSEVPKVATSVVLFGTVAGVQFCASFHRFVPGVRLQVALPAFTLADRRVVNPASKSTVAFLMVNVY